MVLITIKGNQIGIRFTDEQDEVLQEIAAKYVHTPTGVVRLAVEQMIEHYRKTGELKGLERRPSGKSHKQAGIPELIKR